ncbi:MAG: BA14K family protein [Hyphomicrobiaceae bacterium]
MTRSISVRFAKLAAAALAATTVLAAGTASAAPPVSKAGVTGAPSLVTKTQGIYFGYSYGRPYRRHYRPYYYRPYRYYGGPYAYRSYYYGPPATTTYYSRPYVVERGRGRWDPEDVARCASRFRSFSVRTGTYITYGGEERLCPYLR